MSRIELILGKLSDMTDSGDSALRGRAVSSYGLAALTGNRQRFEGV